MRNRTTRLPLAFFGSDEAYCCFLALIYFTALDHQLPYPRRSDEKSNGSDSLSTPFIGRGANDPTKKLISVSRIFGRLSAGVLQMKIRLYLFDNIPIDGRPSVSDKICLAAGLVGYQVCDVRFSLDFTEKSATLPIPIRNLTEKREFTHLLSKSNVRGQIEDLRHTLQYYVDFDRLETTYRGEIRVSSSSYEIIEYFRPLFPVDCVA
jgi:hypothetical protein